MNCLSQTEISFTLSLVMISSVSVLAMNQGVPVKDLGHYVMRTGKSGVNDQPTFEDLLHHHLAFATSLAHIRSHISPLRKRTEDQKAAAIKNSVPVEYHHPQILALATAIDISLDDGAEQRAQKFIKLAQSIRDMYDEDNPLSKNLGLSLLPESNHLNIHYRRFLIADAFDIAVQSLETLEQSMPREKQIDYYLSLTQMILWRLRQSYSSILHRLVEIEATEQRIIADRKSKKLVESAIHYIFLAQNLVDDEQVSLPVIYNQAVLKIAATLTSEQKYELIVLHKTELEAERNRELLVPQNQLRRASGFNDLGSNPLDDFTMEKCAEVIAKAKMNGASDHEHGQILADEIKRYVLEKIPDPVNYFHQSLVQKYLLESGIITRTFLADVLHQKISSLKNDLRYFALYSSPQ